MIAPQLDLRMGIDVGGTNTDAVVLDRDGKLLAKVKRSTTADVSEGVRAAIDAVVSAPGVDRARITHVMLGTTHATNAIVERRNLERVAVIRIGSPSSEAVRPLFGWPADLREAISVAETIVEGGIEFDGKEIVPFDPAAVSRFLEPLQGEVDSIAITSIFAPVSARHELAAEAIVRDLMGSAVHVSLSHEIGSIGLLERENACVLNAALVSVVEDVAKALGTALAANKLETAVFFAQNDGSLMTLDYALRYPVLTIGSGPANSMRGAAYLTGATDGLIADVGGTSTDLGMLANGFPRESSAAAEIGGVRTNFRMPDLVAIALGGGTVVANGSGGLRIGPRSVGYELEERALVFGGDTPTLTDAAVAGGRANLGSRDATRAKAALLERALELSDSMLAEAVDRMKTSRGDCPLIAVGGGSLLVPDNLPGVSEVIRPDHYEVANAIGAAIASVSGQVDRIFYLDKEGGRLGALEEAQSDARERAIRAGANPEAVEIVSIEEIPLTYMTEPAVRIRVKAAGSLGWP